MTKRTDTREQAGFPAVDGARLEPADLADWADRGPTGLSDNNLNRLHGHAYRFECVAFDQLALCLPRAIAVIHWVSGRH